MLQFSNCTIDSSTVIASTPFPSNITIDTTTTITNNDGKNNRHGNGNKFYKWMSKTFKFWKVKSDTINPIQETIPSRHLQERKFENESKSKISSDNQNENDRIKNQENFKISKKEFNPSSPLTKGKETSSNSTMEFNFISQSENNTKRLIEKLSVRAHPFIGQKYRLKDKIGEGSFGFVHLAENSRNKQNVSIKFIVKNRIPSSHWCFDSVINHSVPIEVHLLRIASQKSNQIIQFIECFQDDTFVYLVTEIFGTSWNSLNPLLNGKKNPGLRPFIKKNSSNLSIAHDLFECIEAHFSLSESIIKHIFNQIYQTLEELISLGIVHRDIKDENILIDFNYNIKIIDFGSASWIPPTGKFDRFNGTLAFAAPEILIGLSQYGVIEAEVWTLGILLYTCAFGKPPFGSTVSICKDPLNIPLKPNHSFSDNLVDLIEKMLIKDPQLRIDMAKIKDHEWIKE